MQQHTTQTTPEVYAKSIRALTIIELAWAALFWLAYLYFDYQVKTNSSDGAGMLIFALPMILDIPFFLFSTIFKTYHITRQRLFVSNVRLVIATVIAALSHPSALILFEKLGILPRF